MKTIKVLVVLAVLAASSVAGFVYSGVYNIAADEPHWPLTLALIETLRDRSVEARARSVQVPKLDDPKLIAEGAEHYAAMCTGCHLAPGMEDSELRKGLYPQPPKLSDQAPEVPAEQFWVIKHGLKMTAMPAWGASHPDDAIWGLVAFLQKLPEMPPEEYERMTGEQQEPHHHHEH